MKENEIVSLDGIEEVSEWWQIRGKCYGMAPMDYELDRYEHKGIDKQARARELCKGCEVVRDCAVEAIDPIAHSTVRAGVWIPEQFHRDGRDRVLRSLCEIARGDSMPDDFIELLATVQGHATLAPTRPAHEGPAPAGPLPPRRGVGARG